MDIKRPNLEEESLNFRRAYVRDYKHAARAILSETKPGVKKIQFYRNFDEIFNQIDSYINKIIKISPKSYDENEKANQFRKHIPEECFNKSISRSSFYFLVNLFLFNTCFTIYPLIKSSYVFWIIYCLFYAIIMLRLFLVGHDCIHNSFSDIPFLNSFIGNICLGSLVIPFCPLQLTHLQHHEHPYHIEKDKGIPWMDNYNNIWWPFLPFYALFSYLYFGNYDGYHINPKDPLFESYNDKIKCVISLLFCLRSLFLISSKFGCQTLWAYGIPWILFSALLFLINYTGNRNETTKVYDDYSWNYVDACLESIDREIGIDYWIYNVTNGNVIHHLFPEIPHYNLVKATNALKEHLPEYFFSGEFILTDYYNMVSKFRFSVPVIKQD